MKKLEWLTLPVALVILGVLLIASAVMVGVPVWLVAKGYAPPALLAAPISTILVGGAGAAAAYMKGLVSAPADMALVPLSSIPPPPTEAELLGHAIPVTHDPKP